MPKLITMPYFKKNVANPNQFLAFWAIPNTLSHYKSKHIYVTFALFSYGTSFQVLQFSETYFSPQFSGNYYCNA